MPDGIFATFVALLLGPAVVSLVQLGEVAEKLKEAAIGQAIEHGSTPPLTLGKLLKNGKSRTLLEHFFQIAEGMRRWAFNGYVLCSIFPLVGALAFLTDGGECLSSELLTGLQVVILVASGVWGIACLERLFRARRMLRDFVTSVV